MPEQSASVVKGAGVTIPRRIELQRVGRFRAKRNPPSWRFVTADHDPPFELRGGGLGWGKAAYTIVRGFRLRRKLRRRREQVGSPRVVPPPHPPPRSAGEGARGRRSWLQTIGFTELIPQKLTAAG